jgi:hypothetical protein
VPHIHACDPATVIRRLIPGPDVNWRGAGDVQPCESATSSRAGSLIRGSPWPCTASNHARQQPQDLVRALPAARRPASSMVADPDFGVCRARSGGAGRIPHSCRGQALQPRIRGQPGTCGKYLRNRRAFWCRSLRRPRADYRTTRRTALLGPGRAWLPCRVPARARPALSAQGWACASAHEQGSDRAAVRFPVPGRRPWGLYVTMHVRRAICDCFTGCARI